jgi:glucokinase
MILAGDIGGTKTNLALYEVANAELELKFQKQFSSGSYGDFSSILEEFLSAYGVCEIEALCLGIAGPIIDGVCRTTNLPWVIETKELQRVARTRRVKLLNDLEATAYGMLYLSEEEFVNINPNAKSMEANRAVIAAGTGLGEAMLFYDGSSYHPIGSEGGHCDFAPQNPLQDELLIWMRKRHSEHVSVERLVSGDGVSTIYAFLKEKAFGKEPQAMINATSKEDTNAIISRCALEEKNALCLETMKIFTQIYGAEAGNLALKSLSLGGVYIGGGIAPKILPFLEDGTFLEAFVSKGRFRTLLESMRIKISLNQESALKGAAHFALDRVL